MYPPIIVSIFICLYISLIRTNDDISKSKLNNDEPVVMISLLIRNKEYALPYFLYHLETFDYDKSKIMLWIRSDHNEDYSNSIVSDWLRNVEMLYHSVDFIPNDTERYYKDENNDSHIWTKDRFNKVINLKEEALKTARKVNCDHLLFIDADNIIVNKLLLDLLMDDSTSDIIAPMLNVTTSKFYSNFWCGMNDQLYYERTDDYYPILNRDSGFIGSHQVALVHSTFMINMKRPGVDKLTFITDEPNVPEDDIIRLAYSARKQGLKTSISNRQFYGFMPMPLDIATSLIPRKHERETFNHMILESIANGIQINRLSYVVPATTHLDLDIDKIYVINLKRRTERKEKMIESLTFLGIEVEFVEAVDGRKLNDTYLSNIGVSVLSNFQDPYNPRTMTFGEIGCFLSHYNIWTDVRDNDYSRVLILEDDIRFDYFFSDRMQFILDELKTVDHDLVYLGRKAMDKRTEPFVTESLVKAYYSYWTLGYLLTNRGASILLNEQPLSKMVPVDEYIPIMYNEHPLDDIKLQFNNRNLNALSSSPLLLYPTHYTGQTGHITDTEDSAVTENLENHIQTGIEGPPRHIEL